MTNVVARIYRGDTQLEAGFPRLEEAELLLEQPAHLASPTRPWERAAALEGLFNATLYLLTASDLSQADWVETEDPAGQAALWRIVSHSNAGPDWRLNLIRREVT
jgi:hypothetical protein